MFSMIAELPAAEHAAHGDPSFTLVQRALAQKRGQEPT